MSHNARRAVKITENLILMGIILAFVVVEIWGSRTDPEMTMKALGGLTPDQVILRLGQPSPPDPRRPWPGHPSYKPWTPDQEPTQGPLTFYYYNRFPYWKNYSYAIIFENDRVVKIMRGHK